MHRWLVRYSVLALRISLGIVFLAFGVLKYIPNLSPAEPLVQATMARLTFGLIHGHPALVLTATLECVIGLSLLAGVGLRVVIYLLGLELLGILSPIALLPTRIFAGPHHAPTLEGQYVLKDIILVAASMVVVAASFRGAKISYQNHPAPTSAPPENTDPLTDQTTLAIVLTGMRNNHDEHELCARNNISHHEYRRCQHAILDGAAKTAPDQENHG